MREPQLPRLGRVGNDVRLVSVAHLRVLHRLLVVNIGVGLLNLILTVARHHE